MSTASVTNAAPHVLSTSLTGMDSYRDMVATREKDEQAARTDDAKTRALEVDAMTTKSNEAVAEQLRRRFAGQTSSTAATPVAEPVAAAASAVETLASSTVSPITTLAHTEVKVAQIANQNNLTPLHRLVVASLAACVAMSCAPFLKEASVNCSGKNLEVSVCVETAFFAAVVFVSGAFLIKVIHQTACKAMLANAAKA